MCVGHIYIACGYLSSTGFLMIDRFINAINGCAHDISLRVIFGVDCYCTNVIVISPRHLPA